MSPGWIILGLCAYGAASACYGYAMGKREGRAFGYEDGKKAADNWWIGTEKGADQARQQIWRDEARQ